MQPLVSVVITTYGGVDVIRRAIESVLCQTYTNIEIIVVDDNGLGTDNQMQTEKIVKSCENTIIYIPHDVNKNGSAARNTGIEAAKGKYIALLDDDDSFRNNKIEQQVSVMEQKGEEYGVCYTGMAVHFSDGRIKMQETYFEGSVFEKAILRQMHAQTSEFLLRKESVLKIGGFDESFNRHQDWEFFDRMAYNYKVAVVPEICVDRYIYKRTAAKSPDKFEYNRLYYLQKMMPYLKTLPDNAYNLIISKHYSDIAREYLKVGKLSNAVKFVLKSGFPLLALKMLIENKGV